MASLSVQLNKLAERFNACGYTAKVLFISPNYSVININGDDYGFEGARSANWEKKNEKHFKTVLARLTAKKLANII